jgi:hypothetical protein
MGSLAEALREIMVVKATELFGSYGVGRVEACEEPCAGPYALLGFHGDAVEGSVVLMASDEVIARSNPVGGDPCSWSAELANQLGGRFKNELFRRGLEIVVSLPVVRPAELAAPACTDPPRTKPIELALEGGVARIWLDVSGEAELAAGEVHEVLAEGELLLF